MPEEPDDWDDANVEGVTVNNGADASACGLGYQYQIMSAQDVQNMKNELAARANTISKL